MAGRYHVGNVVFVQLVTVRVQRIADITQRYILLSCRAFQCHSASRDNSDVFVISSEVFTRLSLSHKSRYAEPWETLLCQWRRYIHQGAPGQMTWLEDPTRSRLSLKHHANKPAVK